MKYVSTRGEAPALAFDDVLLTGLAGDGGLYVPESWPQFTPSEIAGMAGLSYPELAVRIMTPFVEGVIPGNVLKEMAEKAYGSFRHRAVAPLVQSEANHFILELFHGPTLAFKDFALQLLGLLLDYVLAQRGEQVTVLGATSGDTGSAAIAGCRGRENMRIYILHPKGRVSEVQRRQMTTVLDANVHNLAVGGTFDDCQSLVKAAFGDQSFREKHKLVAVNSINWARIMAQIVYYFYAALSLGGPGRAPVFSVPTGNFGDIYAGYVANKMGLPIEKLVIATNSNDILTRFFASGAYEQKGVHPTFSPSMDIQISSNFERLLFDLYDRDGSAIKGLMEGFKTTGKAEIDGFRLEQAKKLFTSASVDDDTTLAVIRDVYQANAYILDPHTAVGVKAGEVAATAHDGPLVTLSTAHPAKFPDAVEQAIGHRPGLPAHMADLFEREERCEVVANELAAIKQVIER